MPSMVPTDDSGSKTVKTFGLGTYDNFESGEHGEDNNEPSRKKNLPDAGGVLDPFGPDRFLSYHNLTAADKTIVVHGKYRRPTDPGSYGSFRDLDVVEDDDHTSPPASELPVGGGPSARSDYYDRMSINSSCVEDIRPDGDTGVYASDDENNSLPSPSENLVKSDNSLGAWSGGTFQDQSVPSGFPVPAGSPNSSFYTEYSKTASEVCLIRLSTNIDEVRKLAGGIIKAFGKKDLTRRHVMSYLQKEGSHQFLASDVVRCLAVDHDIEIKDLLDEFPMAKSVKKLAALRDELIRREISSFHIPDTAADIRTASAALTRAIADLERIKNG